MNAARYTDSAEELEEKIMRDLERKIMDAVEGPIMEDERRKAKDVAEAYAALEDQGYRPSETCMMQLKDCANGQIDLLRHILYDQMNVPPEVEVDTTPAPPQQEELDQYLVQQMDELFLALVKADKLARAIEHRIAHMRDVIL